jgi:hypothetical protein
MKRLILSATDYTPAIDLDPDEMTMKFDGVSRPENVGLFYQQVIDWIDELVLDKNKTQIITLTFQLDYCNSASQKYILVILEKLVDLKPQGIELVVNWLYDNGDEKMCEDGEDISDAIGLNFNFQTFKP